MDNPFSRAPGTSATEQLRRIQGTSNDGVFIFSKRITERLSKLMENRWFLYKNDKKTQLENLRKDFDHLIKQGDKTFKEFSSVLVKMKNFSTRVEQTPDQWLDYELANFDLSCERLEEIHSSFTQAQQRTSEVIEKMTPKNLRSLREEAMEEVGNLCQVIEEVKEIKDTLTFYFSERNTPYQMGEYTKSLSERKIIFQKKWTLADLSDDVPGSCDQVDVCLKELKPYINRYRDAFNCLSAEDYLADLEDFHEYLQQYLDTLYTTKTIIQCNPCILGLTHVNNLEEFLQKTNVSKEKLEASEKNFIEMWNSIRN